LDLENLLIFGISFGSASIVSESFLKKYKTYRSFTALTSVDGHIIERLEEMYQNNKIKSITITYYSDAEKIYFNKLFNMTKIKKIVSIQHYSNFL
ncbi:MAG: hypothetical protein KKH98_09490, partial [Spirochaetes bacterium]|nr:hypothetical protein [Spirochaetota bacterium]